jgi:hypothetical protein
MSERLPANLTEEERALLARGLREWGGPAAPTDEVAHLLGFSNVQALYDEGSSIASSLQAGEPLTRVDWRRALMATELVFASDVIGSGVDWLTTTGLTDEETIGLLRSVQRKPLRDSLAWKEKPALGSCSSRKAGAKAGVRLGRRDQGGRRG